MATQTVKQSTDLLWCQVRLGKDLNWWVKKTSDPVNWGEPDGLSIIDPRQLGYILDALDTLREYGLSSDLVEAAFIPFQIQETMTDKKTIRLIRVNESITDADDNKPLFALPDIINEDRSPYAEFLDHITRLRVQLLNKNIKFEQELTTIDLEEQVREIQNQAFLEGRTLHAFQEITDILEYIPDGYELNTDEETVEEDGEDEDLDAVGEEFDLDTDEKIEEDDTMRWDDESSLDGGDFDDNHGRSGSRKK